MEEAISNSDVAHIQKVAKHLRQAEQRIDWIGNDDARCQLEDMVLRALRTCNEHIMRGQS